MSTIPRQQKYQKWSLTFKILPLVGLVVILKFFLHYLNFEFLALNPLLPSLVAATVFLMGFLISGVLSDYKEAEKLPGELAASVETIADEASIIYRNKSAPPARECIEKLLEFVRALGNWFYDKAGTKELMLKIQGFSDFFLFFEELTQANFIARLKQEQHTIRRIVIRINAIRKTSFIQSGYAIAEFVAVLLIVALLFSRMDPFYESMFFLIPITFLFLYLLALIKDTDNPFDYSANGESADEVSLEDLHDLEGRLEERIKSLEVRVMEVREVRVRP